MLSNNCSSSCWDYLCKEEHCLPTAVMCVFLQSGFTPLHISSHYGNINVGSLLIEKGADPNFKARVGAAQSPSSRQSIGMRWWDTDGMGLKLVGHGVCNKQGVNGMIAVCIVKGLMKLVEYKVCSKQAESKSSTRKLMIEHGILPMWLCVRVIAECHHPTARQCQVGADQHGDPALGQPRQHLLHH